MTGMEIALLILGILVFIASFIVPETMKEPGEEGNRISDEKIKEMVDGQIRTAKEQLQDTTDETIQYAMEKAPMKRSRLYRNFPTQFFPISIKIIRKSCLCMTCCMTSRKI